LLARYRRACPGVEVTAIEDNGGYLEHLLVGGELDVAVMVISNLRDRMALQAEILETSPYRLWLPLGHPLVSADIISVADISREPLIMLTIDEIEENTGKLLTAIGGIVSALPNRISIGGHTSGNDAHDGTSWELSLGRANQARAMLQAGGLTNDRIYEIAGKAGSEPLLPEDPNASANRRLSIHLDWINR